MNAPSVTPVQYGATGVFGAVVLACLNAGVTGDDLRTYVFGAAGVCVATIIGDAIQRNGRARNAVDVAQVVADAKTAKAAKASKR